jgi:hypothetical protein
VLLVAVDSQVQDAPGCGAGVEGRSQARPAAGGEAGPAGGSRDSACQPEPSAEDVEEEGSHLVTDPSKRQSGNITATPFPAHLRSGRSIRGYRKQ